LKEAKEAHSKIEVEIKNTTSANAAKKAYAENIKGSFFGNSFPGWVMYGPGGAEAAKKIVKSTAEKTGKDKVADAVKEMLEEEKKNNEKKEEKKDGEKKDEGKKGDSH
jgi:hypothetical protein